MTNVLLAESAARDNITMKTLAYVTIVFLPATFVATLFSMSMFNWMAGQTDGTKVVSSRIWIYWAVTLGLGILVLAVWTKWKKVEEKEYSRNIWERPIGFANSNNKATIGNSRVDANGTGLRSHTFHPRMVSTEIVRSTENVLGLSFPTSYKHHNILTSRIAIGRWTTGSSSDIEQSPEDVEALGLLSPPLVQLQQYPNYDSYIAIGRRRNRSSDSINLNTIYLHPNPSLRLSRSRPRSIHPRPWVEIPELRDRDTAPNREHPRQRTDLVSSVSLPLEAYRSRRNQEGV
jgi:hypothetical protein